ncbi:biopolymer transporter ExbD [Qipengyuania sp. JC766]|uniref:ExbD/TolR family protein n=1 Tax=Qipengyuania sp. JC766 TaxID=3232139 RepID=UPI00345AB877
MAKFDTPMGEMNTTPLIDVLLVLLIMFIITIPVATHSVDVELPQDCADCPRPTLDPLKNKIVIDESDRILWNGTPVGGTQLSTLLRASTQLDVEPELQFEPMALASYDISVRTMKTIRASGVTKFGFVGNEKYREFGRPI